MTTELKSFLTKAVTSYVNALGKNVANACSGALMLEKAKAKLKLASNSPLLAAILGVKIEELRKFIAEIKQRYDLLIAVVDELKAEGLILESEEAASLDKCISEYNECFKDLSVDEDGTVHVPDGLRAWQKEVDDEIAEESAEQKAPVSEEPGSSEEQK